MGRRLLVVAACALFCAGATHAAPSAAWTKTDQIVRSSDGVQLATSLYEPVGKPPAAGWPAIIMFHGIGQTRAPMNTIAEQTFANEGYAVLTSDHRGHGESTGLFDADGQGEINDAVMLYKWLALHPEIDSSHIGAWGISLGGGVVLGSLKLGVFAAAVVNETWVDLYGALAPNNLSKSGAVFQFLNSVPTDRTTPELNALKGDMLNSTNTDVLRAWADTRSTKGALGQIKTPVLIFQGRRDFAFGLDQGIRAYQQLGGEKRLYIGDFGHAPSTFPGPDADVVFAEASSWFDHHLKTALGPVPKILEGVELAPDPYREGYNKLYAGLPPTTTVKTRTKTSGKTFGTRGKVVLTFSLPNKKLEVFGAPVVTVKASTKTKAKQLVAVLEAVTRGGAATIVSEGGTLLPTRSKAWTLSFPLVHDTALIARGSKLRLTLSWTSTAQSPANLLYVTGVPDGSSLTVRSASIKLPVLKSPISG